MAENKPTPKESLLSDLDRRVAKSHVEKDGKVSQTRTVPTVTISGSPLPPYPYTRLQLADGTLWAVLDTFPTDTQGELIAALREKYPNKKRVVASGKTEES